MLHGDILGERARLTPQRTALVDVPTGQRFSYATLNGRAANCARAWIHTLGLSKGDRVAVLANNRVEFLEAYFAAIKSGVVLLPLGVRLTPVELEYILQDSGARVLIYAAAYRETVRALARRVDLDAWIALDEPLDSSHQSHAALRDGMEDSSVELPVCDPEDLCALLYTSGTTGRPKGVMIPQRMVAFNAINTAHCWQLREDDVTSVFTPLYHAGGLNAFVSPILSVGGTVVLHDGFRAAEVLRTIEQEHCTVALGGTDHLPFLDRASELRSNGLLSAALVYLRRGRLFLPSSWKSTSDTVSSFVRATV